MNVLRINSTAKVVLVAATGLVIIIATLAAAKWNVANAISTKTDQADFVDFAVGLGPDDPQTHYAAGVIYQRTFEGSDASKSLAAFAKAAELSPNHFLSWLELGRAYGRAGEVEKGLAAMQRALALAPNYADVHWAYGNALIRSGDVERGFEHVRRAITDKPDLVTPAVNLSFQLLDGDVESVRRLLGKGADREMAIVLGLARASRFDEAFASWGTIDEADRRGKTLAPQVGQFAEMLRAAKKFRGSISVWADYWGASVEPGTIYNGGFEAGVKQRDAPLFDWQIANGGQPQIALSNGQKRSGENSLLMVFDSKETADFRRTTQLVIVNPGSKYEFESYIRTELKALSTVRWDILDANTGAVIASSAAFSNQSDWQKVAVSFSVPANTEAVVIALARTGCNSSICPISGRLWIDDVGLRRLD